MAKLALLALLAALLVVADATIVRTTITTTEVEEDNRHGGQGFQQCSPRQLQGKRFNSCQQYLTRSSRPYDILRVVDVNPFSQEQEMLEECCNELKELRNPQCACEALKKIIREESQQGQGSRYQGQGQQGVGRQMLQKARNIPQQCRIPVESCRIQEY